MKKDTMEAFEEAGINNLTDDELDEQFNKISSQGDLDGNFSNSFVNGISDKRKSNAIEMEKDVLFPGREKKQEQTKAVLSDTGMPAETVDSTMQALDKQGLHEVSNRELQTRYHKLMDQGTAEGNTDTFAKATSEGKSQQLQKERKDVYGEVEYELHLNKSMITNALANKGLPPEMINQTLDTMKTQGIDNISQSEMNRHFDFVVDRAEHGEWKNSFADTFTSSIENERRTTELEQDRSTPIEGESLRSFDETSD